MNNLGKGLLDKTEYQNVKILGFLVSHKKIFNAFPPYESM